MEIEDSPLACGNKLKSHQVVMQTIDTRQKARARPERSPKPGQPRRGHPG